MSCPLYVTYGSGWIIFHIWHKWSFVWESVSIGQRSWSGVSFEIRNVAVRAGGILVDHRSTISSLYWIIVWVTWYRKSPGPCFNIYSRQGVSHYKDETVARQFYLYNGDSYIVKMTFHIETPAVCHAICNINFTSVSATHHIFIFQYQICIPIGNKRWTLTNQIYPPIQVIRQ